MPSIETFNCLENEDGGCQDEPHKGDSCNFLSGVTVVGFASRALEILETVGVVAALRGDPANGRGEGFAADEAGCQAASGDVLTTVFVFSGHFVAFWADQFVYKSSSATFFSIVSEGSDSPSACGAVLRVALVALQCTSCMNDKQKGKKAGHEGSHFAIRISHKSMGTSHSTNDDKLITQRD